MSEDNDVLDPAHADDGGINMGAAGLSTTADKADAPDKANYRVSDDGNIVEVGDKKYITDSAFKAERAERQKLAGILQDLDPVMPEFEEFLKTRNNRRESSRAATAANGEQDSAEYLGEVANALGFYTEAGTPDLRRAQSHLNITRREAQRETAKQVRPVAEHNIRDRADVNRNRARSNKFTDGQPIAEEKYMNQALAALPDEYLADPNIANITQVIAAGMEYLDKRNNGTLKRGGSGGGGRRGPMFVEGSTGRYDSGDDGEMSGLERAAARARGKSPEAWSKLSKQVNASKRDPDVLEEI